MKVSVIRHSEPLPIDGKNQRFFRAVEFSKYLDSLGHKVTFYTSSFNHFQKSFREPGEYNVFNDLRIVALKSSGYGSNIGLKRMVEHFVFGVRVFVQLFRNEKPDVIFSSFPTITSSFFSVLYGKMKGVPVVVDLRDKWPEVFWGEVTNKYKRGIIKLLSIPAIFISRFVFSNADCVTAPTESFLDYARKYSINKNLDCRISPLGYKKDEYDKSLLCEVEEEVQKILPPHKDLVVFAGTVGHMFDFESILKVFSEGRFAEKGLLLIVAGNGELLESLKQYSESGHVFFVGRRNKVFLDVLYKKSVCAIAPYKNTSNFVGHLPNKFSEYLAYGLPVLTCLEGQSKELVCSMGGAYYQEGDTESFFEALNSVLSKDGVDQDDLLNARVEYYTKNLSSEGVYDDLRRLFEDLIPG